MSGLYGLARTFTGSFDKGFTETIAFQALFAAGGLLLILRKFAAVYLLAAAFLTHISGRSWWLLLRSSTDPDAVTYIYLAILTVVYASILYYLVWLKKKGEYYAGSTAT